MPYGELRNKFQLAQLVKGTDSTKPTEGSGVKPSYTEFLVLNGQLKN